MKIALVVPHLFMHDEILPKVIFSPGRLAIWLAEGLQAEGHEVVLFTPGHIKTKVENRTADLSNIEVELKQRKYDLLTLLKKHPLTFITLARQVQAELIADVYEQANSDKFDIVHIWTNEEEIALVNARFCTKPVIFTHHEPFNFLVKYRSIFPKYTNLNWICISKAQQQTLSINNHDFNPAGIVHHGIPKSLYKFNANPKDYFLYFGRIIEPKGVHLAINAAKKAGVRLKIAGKHYAGKKDEYWQEKILPQIDGSQIEYHGFAKALKDKQDLLSNAQALLMPSIWSEPFGLVMIEALACGTPVIGFKTGAIPEVVDNNITGYLVDYEENNDKRSVDSLIKKMQKISKIDRKTCRQEFEKRFTVKRMVAGYEKVYNRGY